MQVSTELVQPQRNQNWEAGGDWSESGQPAYFAQHKDVKELTEPVYRREIRNAFPAWKRWNNLFGVYLHIVPTERREQLAEMITSRNASARALLSPWLISESQKSGRDSPDRELVFLRRQLRDSKFGKLVRQASGGQCAACSSQTDYERLGILEAAYIRSVGNKGPDKLANALALCPNHHALFDEGKWTLDGKKIVLARNLPEQIRETFGRRIKCGWDLDPREIDWHQKKVWRGAAVIG